MNIKINKNIKYQTITGFGVSGAWWSQFVGGWTDIDGKTGIEKRERIAELLFDKNKGIGITQYRYNIGAGSMDSKAGHFHSERMRAESFETAPNVYDWNKDSNAVWFMRAAANHGVDEIVMFVNSPLERLTENHKAYLDKPLFTNIKRKNYDAFAKYCIDVTEHFVKQGLPIKYLSPVNEPVWIWLEKQEGCHYHTFQVREIMKVFAKALNDNPNLKDVKLSGAENGDLRWANKTYTRIMLDDSKVRARIDSVDVHSYFLKSPVPLPFINNRLAYTKRYKKWMDKHYPDVPLKISEWCHMQGGRDYGMNSALAQAKVMAEDLDIMSVVSWQLWVALADGDYCDGVIYYSDKNGENTFELTKRYFALGNFSKYIRPGAVRLDAENNNENVYSLAFEQKDNYAVIIVNFGNEKLDCSIDINSTDKSGEIYITSDEHSLDKFELDNISNIEILPKSVNTVLIKKHLL